MVSAADLVSHVAVTAHPHRPLLVAGDSVAHDAAANEVIGAGWVLQHDGGAPNPRAVIMMGVADRSDAETAVLCAVRGNGLLIRADAAPELIDDLVEDLGKIAPTSLLTRADAVALDVDTWRLLHALSGGMTVAAAARATHVSLRTANRRLTFAKDVLGVRTRAQLLRALSAKNRVSAAVG